MSKIIRYQNINKDFETQRIRLKIANGFVFTINPDLELESLAETGKQVIVTDKAFKRFMAESERYTRIKVTQSVIEPDSFLAKEETAANTVPSKWINIGTDKELHFVTKSSIKIVSGHGDGTYKTKLYLSTIGAYIYSPLSAEKIMELLNELP